MTAPYPLTQPQQIASAAEQFVRALTRLFPGGTFEQFFHAETVRHACWAALQQAVEHSAALDSTPRSNGLGKGALLAQPRVADELLKLFLPGAQPDYAAVAEEWARLLNRAAAERADLETQARALFGLIAETMNRSPDLRLVLRQIGQQRGGAPEAGSADLDRLLEAALADGPGALHRQVRHLLALAVERGEAVERAGTDAAQLLALAPLAGGLSADDLRAAWKAIGRLDDASARARLAARFAPHMARAGEKTDPLSLVRQRLDADPPVSPAVRVDALLDLLPHLGASEPGVLLPALQQRVLSAVETIADPASRVRALSAIIEKLAPEVQREAVAQAFEAAASIPSAMARATALSVLPPHLPPEFHNRLLALARGLSAPDARATLLTHLVAFLAPEQQPEVLDDTLNAIAAINGDDARARALIALTRPIETAGLLRDNPDGVQHAITVTFGIAGADARARAFAVLAPYLSAELLTEALQALKSIADDRDRARTLAQLAPHLTPGLSVAAYNTAQELSTSEARAAALSAIAPYLSAAARATALADALAAALAIEARYERVTALVDLAPHLADALRARALHEALNAARSIVNEDERGRALVFLAPHLPAERLPDALADAYTIADPVTRAPALSALMEYLPDEPRQRVAQDMIQAARGDDKAQRTASILAAIAPALPDSALDDAIAVALAIVPPYDRLHVLTALLPRRPEQLRDTALAAARAVPDAVERVGALLELVPYHRPALRDALLDEALDAATRLDDSYDRASALATIAPAIDAQGYVQNRQQDALEAALEAALTIDDPLARTSRLSRVAEASAAYLTPAQSYTLWRGAVSALRRQPYAEALRDLAALSPLIAHMGSGSAVAEIAAALQQAGVRRE